MSEECVHIQLRQARLTRGESREAMAKRVGLRIESVAAIEEGRFHDLPTGIYARAAIRAYATAVALDPESTLALCASLLPVVDDPIAALKRLRGDAVASSFEAFRFHGIRIEHIPRPGQTTADCPVVASAEWPAWRPVAASVVDALVVSGMLIAAITGTVAIGVPVSALRGAAGPFLALTLVLAVCYFIALGGLVGRTVGESLVGVSPDANNRRALDVGAVVARTRHSMFKESYFIERAGEWIGQLTAGDWHLPPGGSWLGGRDWRFVTGEYWRHKGR